MLSAVNVVSEEEVVGLWWEAAVFEKAQKIVVLTVDIAANLSSLLSALRSSIQDPIGVKSTDLDRCLQLKQDRLGDENFPRFCAKIADFRFQKLDLLSRPAAPHLQQSVNDRIQIHVLISHDVLKVARDESDRKR